MKTYIITEQDIENLKYSVSDIDRFAVDRWQESLIQPIKVSYKEIKDSWEGNFDSNIKINPNKIDEK